MYHAATYNILQNIKNHHASPYTHIQNIRKKCFFIEANTLSYYGKLKRYVFPPCSFPGEFNGKPCLFRSITIMFGRLSGYSRSPCFIFGWFYCSLPRVGASYVFSMSRPKHAELLGLGECVGFISRHQQFKALIRFLLSILIHIYDQF